MTTQDLQHAHMRHARSLRDHPQRSSSVARRDDIEGLA
jgi:hypothetical protein